MALSTTEAEFVAANEGTKELMWLKCLISELLGLKNWSPGLYVDNASAVKLAKNPEFHQRTMHIDVRHFHIRERVMNHDIALHHIEGSKQLADVLTKSLERTRFESLRSQIGMHGFV